MDPKDEGKGFKGLGKLGPSQPPPPRVPPPLPTPPALPPPRPDAGSDGSVRGPTPTSGDSSGCLKVGAIVLVLLIVLAGVLFLLMRWA